MFEFDYFKSSYLFYSLMEYKYFIRYVHFAFKHKGKHKIKCPLAQVNFLPIISNSVEYVA